MRRSLVGLLSSFALLALACGSDTKSGTEGPTENGTGGTNPSGISSGTGGATSAGGASSNGGSIAAGGTALLGGTIVTGGSSAVGASKATGGTAATGGSSGIGGSAAGGNTQMQGGASTLGGSDATSSTAAAGGAIALGGSATGGDTGAQAGTATLGGGGAMSSTAVAGGAIALGGSATGGDPSTQVGTTTFGGSAAEGGALSTGGTSAAGGFTAAGGDTSTGGQSGYTTSSGAWYGYRERALGFATVRVTFRFAEEDCSIALDGLDDSSDHPLINYEGTCVPQVGGWLFTLQKLTVDMGDGPSTLTTNDAGYAELRANLWGDSNAKQIRVSIANDGSALIDFSVNQTPLPTTARRLPDDSSYATLRGTYPEIEYLGLNAHGNPQSPWLSLETMQLAYVGAITNVTVTVRGPAGTRYEDIAIPYDSARQQYHANYDLPNYPSEGLLFIAEAKVTTEKGSSTLLRRDTPYTNFEQLSRTSSGYDLSGMLDTASYRWLAQDYAPPISASQWLIVEAYQNGSSGEQTDPALYAYRESSLTEWFAANDDGGSSLMPKLKLPVASGDRIYIEVQDIYGNGGAYSIFASLTDAERGTTAAPTEDEFEPDDNVTSARSLPLDEFQHHLFQTVGESDWLVVEIP